MSIRLEKPWLPLTTENLRSVKGQLGVYQLGSADDGVTFIGYAGGKSLFGLKGELNTRLSEGPETNFRLEVTTAYQTRYRELLMIHIADHGIPPRDNDKLPRLGKLSPA
jgi:hypothetical protein